MLKRIIAALALTLMASTAMAAGTWADGWDAFDRGDYAEAVGHWRVCGAEGRMACQTMLGVMYDTGQGVTQDYAEAVKWWRLGSANPRLCSNHWPAPSPRSMASRKRHAASHRKIAPPVNGGAKSCHWAAQ